MDKLVMDIKVVDKQSKWTHDEGAKQIQCAQNDGLIKLVSYLPNESGC